jgi:hypothetical protein
LNPPSRFTSLDHLVGNLLEMHRNVETERAGSLEVDQKFKLDRLLDR